MKIMQQHDLVAILYKKMRIAVLGLRHLEQVVITYNNIWRAPPACFIIIIKDNNMQIFYEILAKEEKQEKSNDRITLKGSSK